MVLWAYVQEGLLAEALSHVERWRRSGEGPWTWAAEARVYSRLGRVADARRALERLKQWRRDRPWDPMPMLPGAYLAVNEREKALDSLERLFEERSSGVATLKVDPVYDPLREDSRFQSLLRRTGLAE
jgi:tetratricopeptide (TPR) repeat protein